MLGYGSNINYLFKIIILVNLTQPTSFNGKQCYAIPNNVSLANYKSVGIWCEEFNATFGFASLRSV